MRRLAILVTTSLCLAAAAESVQAAETANGISINGMKNNGISINGMKQNGISINGVASGAPAEGRVLGIDLPAADR
jgi:hypothetical protein